jgi:DNA polymerase IIIc chi subunit
MGVVMFYHLTRSAPEETLAMLLPRALSQGWQVMVRGTDRAALERLDARLWLDEREPFPARTGWKAGRMMPASPSSGAGRDCQCRQGPLPDRRRRNHAR